MKLGLVIPMIALLGCGPAPLPAAAPNPAQPRATAPATHDEPPAVDDRSETDILLDRVASSTGDLDDFQADVTFIKWDNVLGRKETRYGEVIYQVQDDGTARFAILLNRIIVGRRARDHKKHYVFDGSWLVEIDHQSKMFFKRQVVAPGQRMNPFKLGEGPFPLPIGQVRDDVKAQYLVSTLDASKNESLAKLLADTPVHGLLLVPKPGGSDFEQAEIFYDQSTLLPIGICVTEDNGNKKIVFLRNLKRNEGVDEGKLNIAEPDPREWEIDIRPWQD